MQGISRYCPQCNHLVRWEASFCPTCGASLNRVSANHLARLNPFAFPTDTDFRFILLLVTVLGSCLFIYANLYDTVRFPRAEATRSSMFYVSWMIVGSVFTFAVAGLFYWLMPTWKIHQTKMKIITDEAFIEPGLTTYLAELCHEAGLTKLPNFRGRLLDPKVDGQAFGRMGSYYVYLAGGLINLFRTDRPAFRSVVLHELAHLHNADVDKTCFTIALWYAFVTTALPIFAFTLLGSAPLRIVNMSWRVLILLALIYFTRCAILRLREFYADLRASLWDRQIEPLVRVLEQTPSTVGNPTLWQNIQQILVKLSLTHPTLQERRDLLADPTPLLWMDFWSAFATGMTAGIAFVNLTVPLLFWLVVVAPSLIIMALVMPALLLALLVIYIAGVGTWRMTFAALVRNQPVRGAIRLGLGLGCGFILGQQCSFVATSRLNIQTNSLFTSALLLGILPLFFCWVAASAQSWLAVAVTYPSPRPIYRWGLAAASCTFCSILLGFIFIYYGDNGLALLASPVTLLGVAALWAFPLAAWFWQARVVQVTTTAWLYLDATRSSVQLPNQPPLQPQFALLIGLVAGVAGSILLFVLVKVLQASQMSLDLFFFFLGSSACIQAIVALGVALRVKRLGILHGLFSAFIAGCILAVGGWGLVLGRLSNPTVIFMTLNSGGFLALFLAISTSAILAGVQRLSQPRSLISSLTTSKP